MLEFRAAGQLQQRPARRKANGSSALVALLRPGIGSTIGKSASFPGFTQICSRWDTAFEDKHNDYVVGQAWGVHRADRYLLRTYRRRVNLQATIDAMREMHAWAHRKWPPAPIQILIENAASGPERSSSSNANSPGIASRDSRKVESRARRGRRARDRVTQLLPCPRRR